MDYLRATLSQKAILALPPRFGDYYTSRPKSRRLLLRVGMLRGRKTVRADRRLRTDDKAIRAQSTISNENQNRPGLIHNRVFRTDASYPYEKHGWRAQRASPLAA
ncbi:MAG: hypothetical protein HY661_20120 [Betaproteobacteria bacterium]|nr:hypothetical protein [Betaproteobacteria bacterium]